MIKKQLLEQVIATLLEQTGYSDLKEDANVLQRVDISLSIRVRMGSLIALLEDGKDIPENYFILPAGSGIKLLNESQEIIVITPESPVGKATMGKVNGDRCEIKAPVGTRFVVVQSVG